MHDPRDILWHNSCEASIGGALICLFGQTVAAAATQPRFGVGIKHNGPQMHERRGAAGMEDKDIVVVWCVQSAKKFFTLHITILADLGAGARANPVAIGPHISRRCL